MYKTSSRAVSRMKNSFASELEKREDDPNRNFFTLADCLGEGSEQQGGNASFRKTVKKSASWWRHGKHSHVKAISIMKIKMLSNPDH